MSDIHIDFDSQLAEAKNLQVLGMKAARISLIIQSNSLPVHLYGSDIFQELKYTIELLNRKIQELESEGYRAEGFNKLQRDAMTKYGDYGLLIEELRDGANGKLPQCFNTMGNLLARYLDDKDRTRQEWLWTLESMKAAIQLQIEMIQNSPDRGTADV